MMAASTPTSLVTIIGAGLSGVAMGAQFKRQLGFEHFKIYDKADRVGGVWAQNTYPNLSCDVPSEFYSYSFFQSPDWSEKFASQPEILEYIDQCVSEYRLAPHLRLSQECLGAEWAADLHLWTLTFRDATSSQVYNVQTRYLITAVGVFSTPRGLDDLPALREFSGIIFHTGQWKDIDFTNRRVLVIGNGCSANQVIPWILQTQSPKKLVQIVRAAHWIAPKPNYRISEWTKWILRYVPFAMTLRRLYTALQLDLGFRGFYNDEKGQRKRDEATTGIASFMQSTYNPHYHDILLPRYEFGAKRPILDHGYLTATNDERFELIKCDGIKRVEGANKRIIVDQAGNKHESDIVIMANGFKTQDLLVPMAIRGIDGQDLRKRWASQGGAQAYMGVSVNQFPNFFMIGGPNTAPSLNSTLHGIECSVYYLTRIFKPIFPSKGSSSTVSTIMPTEEAERSHNKMLQAAIQPLIYTRDINNWYINSQTGKNTLVWPGTQTSFWWNWCVKAVRWSDWKITYG